MHFYYKNKKIIRHHSTTCLFSLGVSPAILGGETVKAWCWGRKKGNERRCLCCKLVMVKIRFTFWRSLVMEMF